MAEEVTAPEANSATRSAGTPLIVKLCLSAGVFFFAFLAGEVYLRFAALQANSGSLASATEQVEEPSTNRQARLINIIRLSDNERIIYELQPNLKDRFFRGTKVSTDESGFRVQPPVPEDSRPLVTVMGIGDSIMFGHGVEDERSYLYVLQTLLQKRYPQCRWRVINTGVPGYNTAMEVETLRTKGLQFKPDIVILNIVGNDYAPPYFVRNEVDVWDARSFVFDYVEGLLVEKPVGQGDDAGAVQHGAAWYERDDQDQRVIPERYRDLFGVKAFTLALDDLKQLAKQNRFKVLAFTTYEYEKTFGMVAEAKAREFRHSTLMPELKDWMIENLDQEWTAESYAESPLVVSPRNSHPSSKQNRMAAQRLIDDLKEYGFLDRFLGQ
jgi:hypothetical protein